MVGLRVYRWVCVLCVGTLLAAPAASRATETSNTAAANAADAAYEAALDAMLADIANPQKSFDFVEAATKVGDLRGAIAALERMLLINPGLANIELELGVLYLRLGNPQLGRYYIAQALRAPNVPVVVRQRAERYLAVASAETRRSFLHGEVSVGYRYDSNANFAPNSGIVSVYDEALHELFPQAVLTQGRSEADSSEVGSAQLNHSYSMGPSGSSWDTNLLVDGMHYQRVSLLDETDIGLDTGPAIVTNDDLQAPFEIRPFASGLNSWLDGYDYTQAYGGGLDFKKLYQSSSWTELRLQALHQNFDNAPDGSLYVSDRTGTYYLAQFNNVWQIGRLQLGINANGGSTSAAQSYQSYAIYGGGVSLRLYFVPFRSLPPASVYARGTIEQMNYRAAQPDIDPYVKQADTLTSAALGSEIPFTRSLSVSVEGGYLSQSSSLPNFRARDTSVKANVNFRF